MIYILYRHTYNSGIGKNRPKWFSYEKCLNNLLETIKYNSNVSFHMIFDGKYTDPLPQRVDKLIEFIGGSDQVSFNYTWNYAKNLNIADNDLVYFLENDYMHTPDWYDKIIDLFNTYNINGYVSLYDHLDKYTSMYSDLMSQIYMTKTSHWRTVPSTCGSFIINKKILDEDYDVHVNYYGDHHKFIWLGEKKSRLIITPIPSLSTHCEVEWLAPIIDWGKI